MKRLRRNKKILKRLPRRTMVQRFVSTRGSYIGDGDDPNKRLTRLQARMVEEYVKDFNGYRSYCSAGGKARNAAGRACASQILSYAHVQAHIKEKQREMREKSGIEAMDVIKELMRIGFADMTDFASWTSGMVTLKSSEDLSSSLTCAVQEITETPAKFGSTVKIKLHPKISALKMLGEHLNLFTKEKMADEEGAEDKAQKIRKAVNDIFSSVPNAPIEKVKTKAKILKLTKTKEKNDG